MKRILAILTICAITLTCVPIEAHAASGIKIYKPTTTKASVTLKWKKLSAKQLKKVDGIIVVRGKKTFKLKKTAVSYTEKKLKTGTKYTYTVKAYKKQYFNKKTKKWQNKRPKNKKHRGKTRNKTIYMGKVTVTTKKNKIQVEKKPPKKPSAPTVTPTVPQGLRAPEINHISAYGDEYDPPNIYICWTNYFGDTVKIYRDGNFIASVDGYSRPVYSDYDVSWNETHTYKVSSVDGKKEVFSAAKSIKLPSEPVNKHTVEYAEAHGEWVDCSGAYKIFNDWRLNPNNHWYYEYDGSVIRLNSNEIEALTRDETFENLAKARAKERWIACYVNDETGHDGYQAAYATINWSGENLAYMQRTITEVITNDVSGWAEGSHPYAEQGHRRNMLKSGAKYKKVGIAGYKVDEMTCWVMVIGY